MPEITQQTLKDYLNYNPCTGVWRWKRRPSHSVHVGDVAGSAKGHRYLRIRFKDKAYSAHRLAFLYMRGAWPKDEVDHIDHDKLNNRWANLREADRLMNTQNTKHRSNNTSGVMGVSKVTIGGIYTYYKATIRADGVHIFIGCFKTLEKAAMARKQAERRYGFHPNHGR